jgi:PadR family transcriptional regulator, regulatory protein PadR
MGERGFLGELEQMILLAALRLGSEAYGVRLMEELQDRAGRRVSRGSVYITLDRLEEKGWIASSISDERSERGGRPRRVVLVTAEGREQLRRSREALLALWDGVEEVLEAP